MSNEEPVKRASHHEIGADLSRLSIEELESIVERLKGEIERVISAITAKRRLSEAAQSIFKS